MTSEPLLPDDDQLVTATRAGDIDAFTALLDRHLPHVRTFLALKAPVPQLVDELAHDTFVFAYRHLDEFAPGASFRAWLRAIAWNLLRAEVQRFARERVQVERFVAWQLEEWTAAAPEPSAEAEHLLACVGELPEPLRQPIALKYQEDRSGEEISTFQFPFPMDELFRAYPKAFGLTEANANRNTNAWDQTILSTNLATTLPRAAYFCAWSSFQNGAAPLTRYSLVDNTNVAVLLNAPHISNRAAVDWPTYLPMNLNLRRQGSALAVDWAGGALDYSANLIHWTAVTNAAQTWQPPGADGLGIFRVRRER